MLIVLYGKSNQGKTTTLMELAINLAGGGPAMDKSIKAIFNKKSKLNDVRIIIEYKDVFIYIASGGDAWSICKGNTNFFESQFSKQIIYIIDASGLRQMSSEEKISFKMKKSKPKVAICACRPNGDMYGTIKAINAYNEAHIMDYNEQLWIRKDKTFASIAMAAELKKRIDAFI